MPDYTTLSPLIQASQLFASEAEKQTWIAEILPLLTPAQLVEVTQIFTREQAAELAATEAETARLQALLPELHQLLDAAAKAVREQAEQDSAAEANAKLLDLEKAIEAL